MIESKCRYAFCSFTPWKYLSFRQIWIGISFSNDFYLTLIAYVTYIACFAIKTIGSWQFGRFVESSNSIWRVFVKKWQVIRSKKDYPLCSKDNPRSVSKKDIASQLWCYMNDKELCVFSTVQKRGQSGISC